MFFFIGVTNGTSDLGSRKCGYLPCCGIYGASVEVTCVYSRLILFFIPLFRFGKRYFAACRGCGTVYEISGDEGRRIEHDLGAEIDPAKMARTHMSAHKFCPQCGAEVNPECRYCPNCGARL